MTDKQQKPLITLDIDVLTMSDTRILHEDKTSIYLADSIIEAGHNVAERALSTDDIYQIRAMVSK